MNQIIGPLIRSCHHHTAFPQRKQVLNVIEKLWYVLRCRKCYLLGSIYSFGQMNE